MEKVDNEFVNQLKYVFDNFSCADKPFEDGVNCGLYYVLTLIQCDGAFYADHKIDWNKVGREEIKVDNKEIIYQLKYIISRFSCMDKRFEDGFVCSLFYVLTWIQYGKSYADHKINWNKIGIEEGNDVSEKDGYEC